MDKLWRSPALFGVAGAIAGGAVVIAAYLGWFATRPVPPPTRAEHPVAAAPAQPVQPVQSVAVAPQPVAVESSCPSQPLTTAKGGSDGRFNLDPVLGNGPRAEAAAYLSVAREATQQGRVRDAEVALLAACHVAEQASGRSSAPLADVKSQLGQHYVQLAARENADDARDQLLERASAMFSDSASAYATALGRNASKTRLAEERLASVHSPETLRAALREQPETTSAMGAAPDSVLPPVAIPALVRADPELAQLESDLERLRAQAASVSRDPRGMQRRDAQALAQRDARCQDKACLLQWYARRRAQLLNEF